MIKFNNKQSKLFLIITLVVLLVLPFFATAKNYTTFINGKKTSIPALKQSPSGLIFVSEDLIRSMGDSIVSKKGNTIIVKKGSKQLKFVANKTTYWVNGKAKPIATKTVRGKKVTVYAVPKIIKGKFYLPLSVLQTEFCYKVQIKGYSIYLTKPVASNTNKTNNTNLKLTGNPIYDYYLRKPIYDFGSKKLEKFTLLPKLGTPKTGNDKLSLKEGWVMPVLDEFATDNVNKDFEILKNKLEMGLFAPAVDNSIYYSPFGINKGWECIVLGHSNAPHAFVTIWYRYPYYNQDDVSGEIMSKINFIFPQILRFYFPTKWEVIWDNIVGNSGSLERGVIYNLDGREFLASDSAPIYFISEKGGKLDRNFYLIKQGLKGN